MEPVKCIHSLYIKFIDFFYVYDVNTCHLQNLKTTQIRHTNVQFHGRDVE